MAISLQWLVFGVYGMACFLILALANGVSNMFTCDQDAALRDDIRPKVYPYAIFLYMLLKIFTSMDIIFHILTKNEQHVTFGRLASAIVDPAIAYYAMSFYPTGIIYFPFLMDSMVGTINYGLGVRSCADDQTGMIPNWEAKVHNLRMIQYMIALVHSIYSLNNDACECSNSFRYVLLAAHLVLSTSYLAKWTLSGKLTEPSSQPRVRSQHSLKAK